MWEIKLWRNNENTAGQITCRRRNTGGTGYNKRKRNIDFRWNSVKTGVFGSYFFFGYRYRMYWRSVWSLWNNTFYYQWREKTILCQWSSKNPGKSYLPWKKFIEQNDGPCKWNCQGNNGRRTAKSHRYRRTQWKSLWAYRPCDHVVFGGCKNVKSKRRILYWYCNRGTFAWSWYALHHGSIY